VNDIEQAGDHGNRSKCDETENGGSAVKVHCMQYTVREVCWYPGGVESPNDSGWATSA
jgi:hypothetical protein